MRTDFEAVLDKFPMLKTRLVLSLSVFSPPPLLSLSLSPSRLRYPRTHPQVSLGKVRLKRKAKFVPSLPLPSLSPSLSPSLTHGAGEGSHATSTRNSCNAHPQLRLDLHTRSLQALASEHTQHAADSSNRCNNKKKELVALTTGNLALVVHTCLLYWYKRTSTDAWGAACQAHIRIRTPSVCEDRSHGRLLFRSRAWVARPGTLVPRCSVPDLLVL
jgi:hypothetical protein